MRQLGQELNDVGNKVALLSLMLTNPASVDFAHQILTTPVHETKTEDVVLPGGSKVDLDTSIPPTSAHDVAKELGKVDGVSTGPKLEDTSVPGYKAHDGDPLLFMFKDAKNSGNNREHAPDPDKRYIPAPKFLDGFPDATRAEPKNNRARWQLPDKRILEWDKQHGEIEMYDRRGNHLGAYDPVTGNKIMAPVAGRKIEV